MVCLCTFKLPDAAAGEVTVVQHIESHLVISWKRMILLPKLHCSLDKDPLFHSDIKISCPILMEVITNVLGLFDPRKVVTTKLNWSKVVFSAAIKCILEGKGKGSPRN